MLKRRRRLDWYTQAWHGVVAACCLIHGCNPSPPPPPATNSATNPRPIPVTAPEMAADLPQSKSLATLTSLLKKNDQDPEGIVSIGTMTTMGARDKQHIRIITDSEAVQSNGKSYVIACSVAESKKRANVPTSPQVPMAFVFDDAGKLLQTFGSRDYMSKEAATDIKVLSLGTKSSWFIWVERFDFTTNGDYRFSDFYLLKEPIEKVLAVRHYHEKVAYTPSEELAKLGSFVQFLKTKSHDLPLDPKGTAADGSSQSPQLEWDDNAKRFKGPSKITFKDEYLFEVNLDESKGFQATDVPAKDPQ